MNKTALNPCHTPVLTTSGTHKDSIVLKKNKGWSIWGTEHVKVSVIVMSEGWPSDRKGVRFEEM